MIAYRICLPLLLAAAASGQTANPLAGDPKAAGDGLALYRRHCSPCHGSQADGGRNAPDLMHGKLSDSDMVRTISNGVSGTEMAGYAARLSSDDIWRIVAFLRSASNTGTSFSGDPTYGQAVFWGKGGCGNCHAVGNRGSRVGPDLSRIGRQRNVVYLKESLLTPSADIARGFDGVTVTMRDGKKLRGLEIVLDDFSVVLQDFSGKVYSFDRKDLRAVTGDTQSLMPEFGATLSSTELNDVLAYLAGLGASGSREAR